jgi:hypothetical protein
MRILDVITENQTPLSVLNTIGSRVNNINARNHQPNQVTWIKQNLARHRLVTGYRNGIPVPGNMAWTGPIDAQWTPTLDAAIVAWKTSINIQVSGNTNGPLEVNAASPGIVKQDLQYLETTELGRTGLIRAGQDGTPARANINSGGLLDGQTYQPGFIPYGVDHVKNTFTLAEAVGFSAWFRIAWEYLETKNSTDSESWSATQGPDEAGRLATISMNNAFYRDLTATPSAWLTNVGREISPRTLNVTYADGSTEPFIMPSPNPKLDKIYEYYTNMAKRLWEKDRQNDAQARQTADTVAQSPVSGVVLDESSLRAMAAQLNNAFKNDLVAIIPGGRPFSNDVEAIQSILSGLRTATDFNNLSQIYSQLYNGEILHERLWEELEKGDYMDIVVPKLLAIRRIAPRIIHTSINFGDGDSVETEYNGETYEVQSAIGPNGQPVIEGYNGPNDYNVIIIDEILRAAVASSGGTLPDFDTPVDDAARTEAQLAFINTIQNTYPEMVPFYIHGEPFSNASVNIGGARLRGIIEDAARMGGEQIAMTSYITQEIISDRDWLIGTDDTDPAANIRFDERYLPEGIRGRDFPAVSADDDVVLNANEEEIYENLRSPQASVVQAAVDALLQSDEPAQMWENIYRESAPGLWLDEATNMGNGERSIEEFLNGRDDGTLIVRIAREIGLPVAAPRVCAKMFNDAIKGAGTTEETIDALIAQIQNRYGYELIDERYRQLPGVDDSLIDDLASEQVQGMWGGGWYGQLAAIIGDEGRLELIRAELPRRVMDALQDVERSPSNDTIEALRRAISREDLTEDHMSLVVERLQNMAEDMDESPEQILISNFVNELTGEAEVSP